MANSPYRNIFIMNSVFILILLGIFIFLSLSIKSDIEKDLSNDIAELLYLKNKNMNEVIESDLFDSLGKLQIKYTILNEQINQRQLKIEQLQEPLKSVKVLEEITTFFDFGYNKKIHLSSHLFQIEYDMKELQTLIKSVNLYLEKNINQEEYSNLIEKKSYEALFSAISDVLMGKTLSAKSVGEPLPEFEANILLTLPDFRADKLELTLFRKYAYLEKSFTVYVEQVIDFQNNNFVLNKTKLDNYLDNLLEHEYFRYEPLIHQYIINIRSFDNIKSNLLEGYKKVNNRDLTQIAKIITVLYFVSKILLSFVILAIIVNQIRFFNDLNKMKLEVHFSEESRRGHKYDFPNKKENVKDIMQLFLKSSDRFSKKFPPFR